MKGQVGCTIPFGYPALSEDLTGFEKLSGLVVRIRIYRIREFSEWGGFYSVNSEILEILIRTIGNTTNQVKDNSWYSLIGCDKLAGKLLSIHS